MGTLTIPSRQTVVVSPAYKPLYLDELIMENNSILRVEGIRIWRCRIYKFRAGTGCLIDASGQNGGNGADQTYVPGQAGECNNGDDRAARAGSSGSAGNNGVDIDFDVGIVRIDDLLIRTDGGNGGNGGRGGQGQQGGGAKCVNCDGGNGGRGGAGGSAGQGGNAGRVKITWYPETARAAGQSSREEFEAFIRSMWEQMHEGEDHRSADEGDISKVRAVNASPVGLRISSNGGIAGIRGLGGDGGRGGDGVDCGFYSKGGGNRGWNGADGYPQSNGASPDPIVERVEAF